MEIKKEYLLAIAESFSSLRNEGALCSDVIIDTIVHYLGDDDGFGLCVMQDNKLSAILYSLCGLGIITETEYNLI